MTLDACIAHAIHSDLDILEVLPEVHELAVEELEPYIERYVTEIHQRIYSTILESGEMFIRSHDSAGLCATLMKAGISLPPKILLKMCQTIMQLSELEARFILDTNDGKALYYLKMDIAVAS
ncbi:hypothetical protein GX553_03480 [Candidatus Peribacteria bacterium]|nr:hypothetical protein [Candidatus Peribacteria bacterium]